MDLLLGNNSDTVSLGEVSAFYHPYRKHHYNPRCSCGSRSCEKLRMLKSLKKKYFVNDVQKLTGRNIIDSSKDLLWYWEQSSYPSEERIISIVMYKPLIDYCYSIYKRGESINAGLRRFKLYYSRLLSLRSDFKLINYRDISEGTDKFHSLYKEIVGHEFNGNFSQVDSHILFGSKSVSQNGSKVLAHKDDYPLDFLENFEIMKGSRNYQRCVDLIERLHKIDQDSIRKNGFTFYKYYWIIGAKIKRNYLKYFPDENYTAK